MSIKQIDLHPDYQAPPRERGLFLAEKIETASDLQQFSDRLYIQNSDLLVTNPAFLGRTTREVNGQPCTFTADFRRGGSLSPSSNGFPRVQYSWMVAVRSGQEGFISYIETDGTNIRGAIEEKGADGYALRMMDQRELEDAPRLVGTALSALNIGQRAQELRKEREKAFDELVEFAHNPLVDRMDTYFDHDEKGNIVSVRRHNKYVPRGRDFDEIYRQKEQAVEEVGFGKVHSERFSEFENFIAVAALEAAKPVQPQIENTATV